MPLNLEADYDTDNTDGFDNRRYCEGCDNLLTEDDYEDFGCCLDCHEANLQAAAKGIRDGANERSYEEAA